MKNFIKKHPIITGLIAYSAIVELGSILAEKLKPTTVMVLVVEDGVEEVKKGKDISENSENTPQT